MEYGCEAYLYVLVPVDFHSEAEWDNSRKQLNHESDNSEAE
jgi:hypothetical protein